MLLKNKTAIITGCNRGIGSEILSQFAAEGADIYACARKESEEFEKYVKELADRCKVYVLGMRRGYRISAGL